MNKTIWLSLICFVWFCLPNDVTALQDSDLELREAQTATQDTSTEPEAIDEVDEADKQRLIAIFQRIHDGYSSDEVLLQTELNAKFFDACLNELPNLTVEQCRWTLLNLRKQGRLSQIKTTKRNSKDVSPVRHIAEIVTRSIQDEFGATIDRIMCSPEMREAFEQSALSFDEEIDLYSVRKAAFQLRKTRKLRPELITRIADWGRVVTTYEASSLQRDLNVLPEQPGIYLFYDDTGYLYIGEAANLRTRLTTHLDSSDRLSLASYLNEKGLKGIQIEVHTFEEGSRIKDLTVRRAYESELIRSRNPRFNIRP
ncbi:MAG: excinuclease ABC subunit C [Pirellulaceae bacterium]